MKKRHDAFSGLSCCLGTVCLYPCVGTCWEQPQPLPAETAASHTMGAQVRASGCYHRVNSTIRVEVHAQHKIWEKEMSIWDIYHCTPEFQKPIPSVHTHHSVTGITDRIDSALIVLVWHCSNLHLFHYQLQK